MSWRRSSIWRVASKRWPTPIYVTRDTAICAGARTARSSNSTNSTRVCTRNVFLPLRPQQSARRLRELDVATVIKASQAVSSEIVLDKLIEKLMRIAVEHAGAERGLLILLRGR